MPVLRNTRRSRRLLNRPPADPEFETLDEEAQTSSDAGHDDSDSPRTPELSYSPASTSPSLSTTELSPPSSPHSDDSDFAPPRSSTSSHGRKKKEGHIPRPSNAFIIFRSELWKHDVGDKGVEQDHRQISRIAGMRWRELDAKTKEEYKRKARIAKEEHAALYPDYKYAPTGKRKVKKRKTKANAEQEVEKARAISNLISQGFKQEELQRALQVAEQQGMLEHQAAATNYAARPARAGKVPSRPARPQTIAPRPRQQPRKGASSVTSPSKPSSSALGLELHNSPEAFRPELPAPEFVPPCSTLDEVDLPSLTVPYLLWQHPGCSEDGLLDPAMSDFSTLGMSFGGCESTFDPSFGGAFVHDANPLHTPLQPFAPLEDMSAPLQCFTPPHIVSSPLGFSSPSMPHLTSPAHVSSPLPLGQQPTPALTPMRPMLGLSPYSKHTRTLMPYVGSPLASSPESSSSSSSGSSLGSPDGGYSSISHSSPTSSNDGANLFDDSSDVDPTANGSYTAPDLTLSDWIHV